MATAWAEFRRMLVWITVAGVLMTFGALCYLSLLGLLTVPSALASVLAVFLSVALGAGLFAAGFFSSKSGHDQNVTDATRGGSAFRANPAGLPPGLAPYRRTAVFTTATLPNALLADHATKAGTWGLIHVIEGLLRYRVTDPRRAALDTILTPDLPPGIVEPAILHHVEPLGFVRFQVEFWHDPTPPSASDPVEAST